MTDCFLDFHCSVKHTPKHTHTHFHATQTTRVSVIRPAWPFVSLIVGGAAGVNCPIAEQVWASPPFCWDTMDSMKEEKITQLAQQLSVYVSVCVCSCRLNCSVHLYNMMAGKEDYLTLIPFSQQCTYTHTFVHTLTLLIFCWFCLAYVHVKYTWTYKNNMSEDFKVEEKF